MVWFWMQCVVVHAQNSASTHRKIADLSRTWSLYAYICILGLPYAYREGGQKFRIWGVPIRIMKLCAYWEQHIYAEPQHKLLFRVVRGGGGDFWAPFWICLCMYVCMFLSIYLLENSNFSKVPELCLSLSRIKIENLSYLHTLPEKLFLLDRSISKVP